MKVFFVILVFLTLSHVQAHYRPALDNNLPDFFNHLWSLLNQKSDWTTMASSQGQIFKPIFYFRKSNPLITSLEIQKGVNRIYSLREALEQFLKKRRNEKNRMTTESTTTFRPEEFTTAPTPTNDFPKLSISRLSYK